MKDANTQSHDIAPDSAAARWSRFQEAARGLVDPEQWKALEVVWSATSKSPDQPVTEADFMRQPAGSLVRIQNADGTILYAYRAPAAWHWCEAGGEIRTGGNARPWGVPGRTCRIVARNVPQISATQIAAELRPLPPEPAKTAPSEVLPRVVEWSDLQLGDLALDVAERGAAVLGHHIGNALAWRRCDGSIFTVDPNAHLAIAHRALLFARNVPDDTDLVRCAYLKVTPELEAEARRPAP